jgi:hypothetical protein
LQELRGFGSAQGHSGLSILKGILRSDLPMLVRTRDQTSDAGDAYTLESPRAVEGFGHYEKEEARFPAAPSQGRKTPKVGV